LFYSLSLPLPSSECPQKQTSGFPLVPSSPAFFSPIEHGFFLVFAPSSGDPSSRSSVFDFLNRDPFSKEPLLSSYPFFPDEGTLFPARRRPLRTPTLPSADIFSSITSLLFLFFEFLPRFSTYIVPVTLPSLDLIGLLEKRDFPFHRTTSPPSLELRDDPSLPRPKPSFGIRLAFSFLRSGTPPSRPLCSYQRHNFLKSPFLFPCISQGASSSSISTRNPFLLRTTSKLLGYTSLPPPSAVEGSFVERILLQPLEEPPLFFFLTIPGFFSSSKEMDRLPPCDARPFLFRARGRHRLPHRWKSAERLCSSFLSSSQGCEGSLFFRWFGPHPHANDWFP